MAIQWEQVLKGDNFLAEEGYVPGCESRGGTSTIDCREKSDSGPVCAKRMSKVATVAGAETGTRVVGMRQGGTEVSTAIAVSLRAHLGCIKKHWKKPARENDLMWFIFSGSSVVSPKLPSREELKVLCTEGNMEGV